jgi:hypothetical protein
MVDLMMGAGCVVAVCTALYAGLFEAFCLVLP